MSLSGRLSTDESIVGKIGVLNTIEGKSAYEIALLNGFDGTEEEWIASLKGEKGDAYIITEADKEEIADKVAVDNLQESAEKYIDSVIEEKDLEVTRTATGSAITIDSANAPLQNLKLFGKTTQDGTPTPDAPVPLVSVGDSGSFEVGVYKKNLLAPVKINHNGSGLTVTDNNDGTYTLNGTPTGSEIRFINGWNTVKVGYRLPIGKYRFNAWIGDTEIKGVRQVTIADGTGLIGTYNNSFEITSQGYGISTLKIAIDTDVTYTNAILKLAIFTEEFKNSPYEPPTPQTLTMPYTLRSVGDIKDEVDFNRGVKIQRVGKVVLNGSETWYENWQNANTPEYIQFYLQATIFKNNFVPYTPTRKNGLCNLFEMTITVYGEERQLLAINSSTNFSLQVKVLKENIPDLATFKTWLSGNNVEVVYELETPIETPISESELNAYRHLMTNKPNTTILSEAEMQLDYYVNKPNAQAIGSLHSQINKDYLKLQQAIISTGGEGT
jgi:hypothetical protein